MTVRMARIGDILELRREPIDVIANETYQEIGVRSFGKGLFIKPAVTGAEIGSKRVFAIQPGDLVVSNIFGWEGAVAVATSEHAGMIGSHRFMTWVPKSTDLDVRYLQHCLLSDTGLVDLRTASPGSAGRNRTLSINGFSAIRVPLLDPIEQCRVSAHLDGIDSLRRSLPATCNRAIAALDIAETGYLESLPARPVHECATVNPRPDRVENGAEIVFVPMEAVDQKDGTISRPKARLRSDLTSGYKQFRSGDIIFARITPCMQNGKCAIYTDLTDRPAYGSTEFHIVRPNDPADRQWMHTVLRTRWFRDSAMASFTGTAGQQRVPASFLREATIPLPRGSVREEALRRLIEAEATRQRLREVSSRRSRLASSLLPAARNKVFSALR